MSTSDLVDAGHVEVAEAIDALIGGDQFSTPQADKERSLLAILRPLCEQVAAACPPYGRFLARLGTDPSEWTRVADVPPLPVTMFKRFELSAVPSDQVVRELHSSSTSGQSPSRIFIDKTTAFRQARALVSILKDAVGGSRRPYLVIDAEEAAAAGDVLTARGAAIRGIGSFAKSTTYALRSTSDGRLEPDWEAIDAFFESHGDEPVLIFGFTFIVWTRFVGPAEERGAGFDASAAVLLHSGGWKKLEAYAVSKAVFNDRVSEVLGTGSQAVLDFYGMVEQVGTVFVDCPAGNKHAPAFADVVIRRPHTLEPVAPGETGIIEVVSVLPTSYPGQALLTEAQGTLIGVDDCPCGRSGQHFRFTRRVERAEVRGCGDTFAAKQ